MIGLFAMAVSGIIGTALGLAAGFFGGRVDAAIMFLVTTRLSMPVILIALSTVALVKGSLTVVILILGLLLWDRFAVVVRGATMQVRNLEYVAAAECLGCSRYYVIAREILPNVMAPVIVIARSRWRMPSCSRRPCPSSASASSRRRPPGG
jgi:peptide/nickel transport system permease protein